MIGERKLSVELLNERNQAGNLDSGFGADRVVYADPDIEHYPGYQDHTAEEAAERKRLEALY